MSRNLPRVGTHTAGHHRQDCLCRGFRAGMHNLRAKRGIMCPMVLSVRGFVLEVRRRGGHFRPRHGRGLPRLAQRLKSPAATTFFTTVFVAVILAAALAGFLTLSGAEPLQEDRGAVGLWQTLKKLGTTARVLHVTAHPDDEDGGTLALLSRGHGVEVTLAVITRGESGANLVTGDFFDGLGALRTLELGKAAQYYGAQVRFSRYADYGFSKNLEEALRTWDREEILRDFVRIIRAEKPHVILARFRGGPRDGHGQHQTAGLIAQEAYKAAGDPARFPELAREGLKPWQPLKLYDDNRRENEDWTVAVDAGVYDPMLGRTYAQMAREGLRFQRSQGSGSGIMGPGPAVGHYKLLASEVGMADKEDGFFERLNVSIAQYPEIEKQVIEAQARFSPADPAASAPALAAGLQAVRKLRQTKDSLDLEIKESQFSLALEQALGITFDAFVAPEHTPSGPFASFQPVETFQIAVPGQVFEVTCDFLAAAGAPPAATLTRTELLAPPGWKVEAAGDNRFRVNVAADAPPTKAYWSRESVWAVRYEYAAGAKPFGKPLPAPPLRARATYTIAGVEASVEQDVQTSFVDTIGVQHRRALVAGPAVAVRIPTEAGVLPLGSRDYSLSVVVRNNAYKGSSGVLKVKLPAGWGCEPESVEFGFDKEGEERDFRFTARAPAGAAAGDYPLEAVAVSGGREYSASFEPISYPGLPAVYLSHAARHTVRVIDVKTASGLRAGYVMGTGDDVPQTLGQLGATVDLLDTAALAAGDLTQYDTILLGIRAYAARQDVHTYNARLLEYVENGGVLVVQYNTPEYDNDYGPYPYVMGRRPEEVSEEDSPVEILDPNDPVFTTPNRITAKDFEGWVEQRGSKFLESWDPAYKPLLATNDTGQKPQRGGWLVAHYGKGLYIYCAYAWYRQLPYAVPGGVRLFANLVSLGAKDAPWRKP
jgi:LmbE family N-acetylglucosaminyl deacetylase